jgi:hypothetical protein
MAESEDTRFRSSALLDLVIQNLIYTAYEGGAVQKKADEAVAEVTRIMR